jgi:cytochrome c oxidase subunit 2
MLAFTLEALVPPTKAAWISEWNLFLAMGVAAAVFTIGWLVVASVKYRVKENEEIGPFMDHGPEDVKRGWLTGAVTGGILVVVLITSILGVTYLYNIPASTPNHPSITVDVYAFRYGWNFTYANGYSVIGNLTVPANTTIILNITSKDVFHDLGIAYLDVKADAIPGQWNSLWFQVPTAGIYLDAIRCYELCGPGHAYMIANLTVLTPQAYQQWYDGLKVSA